MHSTCSRNISRAQPKKNVLRPARARGWEESPDCGSTGSVEAESLECRKRDERPHHEGQSEVVEADEGGEVRAALQRRPRSFVDAVLIVISLFSSRQL